MLDSVEPEGFSKGPTHFDDLPDEVIHRIFENLPSWKDVLACQFVCNRFKRVGDTNSLWKPFAVSSHRFWGEHHSRAKLLKAHASDYQWKGLMRKRFHQNKAIRGALDRLIKHSAGRIANIRSIALYGDDAKDFLLDNISLPVDQGEGLARSFWALETLGNIDRTRALQVWKKLKEGGDDAVPLEEAFGAFDLLIARPAPLSLEELSERLDQIAADYRSQQFEFDNMTPRNQAIDLVKYLASKNFFGLGHTPFERVQNSLIGVALCDPTHPSLAILSCVIYSCVARRLGIDARPCAFPGHVLGVVSAKPGFTLDGEEVIDPVKDTCSEDSRMYFDLFNGGTIIPVSQLEAQLGLWGISASKKEFYLGPAKTTTLVARTESNLRECLRRWDGTEAFTLPGDSYETVLTPQAATYAIAWAGQFFEHTLQLSELAAIQEPPHLLLSNLQSGFKQDTNLIRDYLAPLYREGREADNLNFYAARIQEDDEMPRSVQRRAVDNDPVRYRVGLIFEHKRYAYRAMIIGWDTRCKADDNWITRMRVDDLSRGRDQGFYHIIDDHGNPRYIAEQNIEVIRNTFNPDELDESTRSLMRMAGRYFKRIDRDAGQFVSNLEDQFPDE